jgi:apoptotic chromatin condensation inducer in the nucleus
LWFQLERRKTDERGKQSGKRDLGITVTVENKSVSNSEANGRDSVDKERKADTERTRKREVPEGPPPKSLEELFRKTKAAPAIYYLPLTEEQADKRQQEKKDAERSRAERRESDRERGERRRVERSPDRKRRRNDSPPSRRR